MNPTTEDDDTGNPLSFDYVMEWIINVFAALGAVAFAALIGLYCAGFFHWLFERASKGGA